VRPYDDDDGTNADNNNHDCSDDDDGTNADNNNHDCSYDDYDGSDDDYNSGDDDDMCPLRVSGIAVRDRSAHPRVRLNPVDG
jgi:hypothetical protein